MRSRILAVVSCKSNSVRPQEGHEIYSVLEIRVRVAWSIPKAVELIKVGACSPWIQIPSPKPSIKIDTFKDGFHLLFNCLKIHYRLKYLIRDKVVKLLSNYDIYKGYLNSVESIIDKAVIHANSWILPFTKKTEGQLSELTNIFNKTLLEEFIKFYKDIW